MKKKMTPEDYTKRPLTGVEMLSGFGTPRKPPEYDLDNNAEVIPKSDTHPGTGLRDINGKIRNIRGKDMLGEED